MTKKTLLRVVMLALPVALAGAGAGAEAETLNCTSITSLPAVVSSQGVYCLTGHLTTSQTSGNAIEIDAPNVVLDLNGWKVGGQAAGKGTSTTGIFSSEANVTIKNGTVRGFLYGIRLTGAGAVVEDVLVDQSTNVGISVGPGSIVRRNQVVSTGGSTLAANGDAKGIEVADSGTLIEDNVVSGLYPVSGDAIGVFAILSSNNVIRGNTLVGSATPPAGYGLYVYGVGNLTAVDNVVSNFGVGVGFNYSNGIYARNVADGCTTKYVGGTPGTGND